MKKIKTMLQVLVFLSALFCIVHFLSGCTKVEAKPSGQSTPPVLINPVPAVAGIYEFQLRGNFYVVVVGPGGGSVSVAKE